MTRTASFIAIRTEGGLLPPDFLYRVAAGDRSIPGLKDADYHLPPGERIGAQIAQAWKNLTRPWANFATELHDAGGELPAGTTREHWLIPLFQQLGYGRLLTTRALEIDGKSYPISHQWGAVPIHLVGAGTALDRRQAGVRGAASASPHSMVQELLNRSKEHLWAMVSNGRRLRLLRDNASLTRQAYLEFDLEAIFADGIYDEFVLLWLLCHESRPGGDDPHSAWLERWVAEAAAAGTRALESLQGQVETAIDRLGRGFVAFSDNHKLRRRLRAYDLTKDDYYRQLLRLVYRLIFLFVAEDRGLLFDPAASDTTKYRYVDHYSLARLRGIAAGRSGRGPHPDLWRSLCVVMRGLSSPDGCPELGLPPLGSFLWSEDAIPDLDGADIANTDLLAAIRALALIDDKQAKLIRAVDYRNLGADELGGIYEGLLDLHPDLDVDADHFTLGTISGSERKTTGSYYTPEPLIAALLDLALDPLLDEASRGPDPEAALLALKVLDPAAGSGHFLVAAARRIAKRLAAVRTGDPEPGPDAVRTALRDTVSHCVYGIDVNPMAVELCKVSLWMQGTDPGLPLSFLDSHVVCGNALLGAIPAQLEQPIPDAAYSAVFDDDKLTVTALRNRNKSERSGQGRLSLRSSPSSAGLVGGFQAMEGMDESTLAGVRAKERAYAALRNAEETRSATAAADAWCSAFLAPKRRDIPGITQATLMAATTDPDGGGDDLDFVRELAGHYRLLHPHLAFPAILGIDGNTNADTGWRGGFDLVLGNPPWDSVEANIKEFFAAHEPRIRFAKKDEQEEIVRGLTEFPEIASGWHQYQRDVHASLHFFKESGRYRLFPPGNLGKGRFNVFRMFVESALQLVREGGYVAQVLPASFYGGANAMAIRLELFEHCGLEYLLGFINSNGTWFLDVHRALAFCLYSARRGDTTTVFRAAFGISSLAELSRALEGATSVVSVEDIRAQSPDSLAIPEVTGTADAALAVQMARQWSAFGNPTAGAPKPTYQQELNVGSDRDLFGDEEGLPVYEGRMVGQFDHRAKAYRSGRGRAAVWEALPFGYSGKAVVPQWRLPEANLPPKVGDRAYRYRVGWCDVTSSQNERSLVAALIPRGCICGHKVPTFEVPLERQWEYMVWLAVFNSFCIDFLARKKVSLSMTMNVLDSLPFPRLTSADGVARRIGRLALNLTCTSREMTAYWNLMAGHGWCEVVPDSTDPPGFTDPHLREGARAEIDAIVARELFGLSATELSTILDTFPVLARREQKAHKEFVTKRLVLQQYAALEAVGDIDAMPSVLD